MAASRLMPPGLVQSTLPDPAADQAADQADGENGQSRGGLRTYRPRRGRRRRAAGEKVSGRKFQLPDAIFERVQLAAIRRRTNPSEIVAEILDRNLPKLKIATEE